MDKLSRIGKVAEFREIKFREVKKFAKLRINFREFEKSQNFANYVIDEFSRDKTFANEKIVRKFLDFFL